jgi:ATP-dependent RNA helicase RhlE
MTDFSTLNLSPVLQQAIQDIGYTTPSPIQAQAIPVVLDGQDVLGCAQTGTGKTAAFLLPIIQKLLTINSENRPIRALVLSPTRELAAQIGESFAQYAQHTTLRHTVIFGGVKQGPQVKALKRGLDVLIATPGRLLDLQGQGLINLSDVNFFVLDEADRMLDMGFLPDIRRLLNLLPAERQNLLFSATMPTDIVELASSFLNNPTRVEVDPESSTVDQIEQLVMYVEQSNKKTLLKHLLHQVQAPAIVFTRTKHGANRVAKILDKDGITAAAIHGNKSQNARIRALEDFKSGDVKVLVATDIASRGIDVDDVGVVFNYDLPNLPESYVHRIGRTGRAGASGRAIAFCTADEAEYLVDIEQTTGQQIPDDRTHEWHYYPALERVMVIRAEKEEAEVRRAKQPKSRKKTPYHRRRAQGAKPKQHRRNRRR